MPMIGSNDSREADDRTILRERGDVLAAVVRSGRVKGTLRTRQGFRKPHGFTPSEWMLIGPERALGENMIHWPLSLEHAAEDGYPVDRHGSAIEIG